MKFDGFILTRPASVICSTSGTISCLSSLLLMYTIFGSVSKLKTSYHRIMFFISFVDLLTSFSMALTTVPMPFDNFYTFDTGRYGNTLTCSLQGFFAYVGSLLGIFSICTLCIYYVSVLKYKLKEETIKRFIEPTCCVVALVFSLYPGIMFLKHGLINPQAYEPYCTIGPYPFECQYVPEIPCIRGEPTKTTSFLMIRYYFIVICIGLCTVTLSMFTIVLSTYAAYKKLSKRVMEQMYTEKSSLNKVSNKASLGQPEDPEEEDLPDPATPYNATVLQSQRAYRYTKIITFQAIMYILAFFLTWAFVVMTWRLGDRTEIAVLKMIFNPLQGFFNAFIFIGHKVHNVKQSSPHLSSLEALRNVIFQPNTVPEIVISKVELVAIEKIHTRLRQEDENDLSFFGNGEEEESQEKEVSSMSSITKMEGNLQSLCVNKSSNDSKGNTSANTVLDSFSSQKINLFSVEENNDLIPDEDLYPSRISVDSRNSLSLDIGTSAGNSILSE